jgi:hypothetical protein
MLSIGLWRLYINITIIILDIIHRPVFYLKQDISETTFCPRPQTEPSNLGQINRASLCLQFHLQMQTEPSLRNSILNKGQDDR